MRSNRSANLSVVYQVCLRLMGMKYMPILRMCAKWAWRLRPLYVRASFPGAAEALNARFRRLIQAQKVYLDSLGSIRAIRGPLAGVCVSPVDV